LGFHFSNSGLDLFYLLDLALNIRYLLFFLGLLILNASGLLLDKQEQSSRERR
jgi:hypothetical protein